MAWTEEQKRAIFTKGQNIIVSAGAGSGKTAVLSERILEYCLQGNDIRDILVLTFTNAAAHEMKERIRKKLLEHKLYDQADLIDVADITTFDAYSLSLVKKYYYKLGLSKDVSIMDETMVKVLRKKIIEDLFEEYYNQQNQAFFSFLRKYSKQDDKAVVAIVKDLCEKLELILHFDEFKAHYEQNYYNREKLENNLVQYEKVCLQKTKEFVDLLRQLYDVAVCDAFSATLAGGVLSLIENLLNCSTYEQVYYLLNEYSLPRVSPKAGEEVGKLKKKCTEFLKNLQKKYFSKYSSKQEMIQELYAIKEDILFLLNVCDEVNKRFSEYKRKVMLYDYIDIAKFAIQLVEEYEDIRKELKKFKEILVDEYQDTSDIQEAFLQNIENDNLYMVGDIKQSIYRFRNANPQIFKEKYDLYAENKGGIKIDLTYNFRSRNEVIETINRLFSKLMTEECGNADYVADHRMQFGQALYTNKENINYNLEILKYNAEDYEKFEKDEIEAFIAARQIQEWIRRKPQILKNNSYVPLEYKDIAILIDKSKSFVTFKKIFEYLNIPLAIEADLDLKDSILPQLFFNIMVLIYKRKIEEFDIPYKHALASVARSFLLNYTDEEIYRLIVEKEEFPIIHQIENLIFEEISYPDLFYKICFEFHIYEKLDWIGDVDNSLAVLEYIYTMFSTFQNMGLSFKEVIEYMDNVLQGDEKLSYTISSPSKDCVRIMTIHKSKGLEFAYCIYPMLSNNFNKKDVHTPIGFHKNYGIYIPYVEEGSSNTIVKSLIENAILKEDISEKVRLLYVALTRTREKMVMLTEEKDLADPIINGYSCFQQMIGLDSVFKNEIRTIDLSKYGITEEYKKDRNIMLDKKEGIILEYSMLEEPKVLEQVHISKEMKTLPSRETKSAIELGLLFHSALECIDFKDKRVDHLPVSDFVKNKIEKLLSLPIFDNACNAKVFHEHEFIFTDGQEQYHGIIDLMLIYEDHIDLLDYKLANVDSKEYIFQLSVYKKYIQSQYDLRIDVYLVSILNTTIKKLDIE